MAGRNVEPSLLARHHYHHYHISTVSACALCDHLTKDTRVEPLKHTTLKGGSETRY